MANFALQKFDDDLWFRVKRRALEDRLSLKDAVLALLKLYAAGKVKLT